LEHGTHVIANHLRHKPDGCLVISNKPGIGYRLPDPA